MSESALNNYNHVVSELYLNNSKTYAEHIPPHAATDEESTLEICNRKIQPETPPTSLFAM